jgi:uncharacterized BrkB/YihY/UPF0761 family membrane protein
MNNTYKIASILNQLFLVLLFVLFIMVMQDDLPRIQDSQPFDWVALGVIVLLYLILMLYHICPPARVRRKNVLRVAAMVALTATILFQLLMIITVFETSEHYGMVMFFLSLKIPFVWSAGTAFWGVYSKKF